MIELDLSRKMIFHIKSFLISTGEETELKMQLDLNVAEIRFRSIIKLN